MPQYLRLFLFAITLVCSLANAQETQAWLSLLRQGKFAELEAETITLQKQFAAGEASEFALRQAYRPFYDLTEQDLLSLDDWQKAQPKSYAVRLIRGTYYRRAGYAARGNKFAAETPPENFYRMRKLHAIALPQLEESLALTESPYLSIFHLLDLHDENRPIQKMLLEASIKILPSGRLVRGRYMRNLAPRWGGSYEAMWAFLNETKGTGANDIGLLELTAIIHDDIGKTALRSGDRENALLHFKKAIILGEQIGGEVPSELTHSWHYRCKLPELRAYCR